MKVKELLTDSSKWTQGQNARDENDNYISVHSELAVKWCLFGAAVKCYSGNVGFATDGKIHSIINKIHEKINRVNIVIWNDSHTFEEVKQLIEELDI